MNNPYYWALGVVVVVVALVLYNAFTIDVAPSNPAQEQGSIGDTLPAASSTTEVQPTAPVAEDVPVPAPERDRPGFIVGTAITEANVHNAVNAERYDAGLPILSRDARLDVAAEAKLQDMIERGYFAHVSPDGIRPQQFMIAEGYPVQGPTGENLARDFDTIDAVTDAWMASLTHRANILSSQYVSTGIAVEGPYVVQMFGYE